MRTEIRLGDIGTQLDGLESIIDMICLLVRPNKSVEGYIGAGTPSEGTMESAFYGITPMVSLIRGEIDAWDVKVMALERKVEELERAAQQTAASEARGGSE